MLNLLYPPEQGDTIHIRLAAVAWLGEVNVYKLLVVDDEPKHRRCLAQMIEDLRPEYKVYEAKNGKEALELIDSERMDVVITDIRMPIMDGISFMEAINLSMKGTKVIILSGFAYFEYAQKALSLGAFDYVLKPVNQKKILEILIKVEDAIEKEIKEQQHKIQIEKQLNTAFPAYIDQLFNGLVNGYLNADDIKEIETIFPYRGKGFVIATELVRLNDILKDYNSDEIYEMKLNVKQWIKETLNPAGHTISFFLESNRNIMITVLNTNTICGTVTRADPYMLNSFVNNLKASYRLDAFIGIGSIYEDIFNSIRQSFDEALLALNYKFYEDKKRVLLFEHYKDYSKWDHARVNELTGKVREVLLISDFQKASELIYILCESANGIMPPQQLKELIGDLVIDFIKQFQNQIYGEQKAKLISDTRRSFAQAENPGELKQAADHIFTCLKGLKASKNDKIIKACEKYVHENYMKDISLETIAERFFFNPSYFSSYFKNNAGMNFSDYLQKIRMEKAGELLRKHNLRVYEVAEKVGYQNVKYFNKVFKKEYGVSPDEYRRSNNI